MSTSDVPKIEWAHSNFLRYSKLKLGWCFRVRRPIETSFACHIHHLMFNYMMGGNAIFFHNFR